MKLALSGLCWEDRAQAHTLSGLVVCVGNIALKDVHCQCSWLISVSLALIYYATEQS